MTRVALYFTAFCMVSAAAHARSAEGRLAGVFAPHEAAPAAAAPGGVFAMLLDFEVSAQELRVSLRAGDTRAAGGIIGAEYDAHRKQTRAQIRVAPETPPGLYALDVSAPGKQLDVSRALFVHGQQQTHFILAVLRNPALGDAASAENFARLIGAVNASGAHALIVAGNLTQDGTAGQFGMLLEALAHCATPVWLTPGENDHRSGLYSAYCGAVTQRVQLGPDTLLLFDSGAPHATAPGSAQAGVLHQLRREARAARWTLAVTAGAGFLRHIRYPLALFVDDPVDALVFPGVPIAVEQAAGNDAVSDAPIEGADAGSVEASPSASVLPWGRTKLLAVPDSSEGEFLVLDLLEGGIFPRGAQSISAAPDEPVSAQQE